MQSGSHPGLHSHHCSHGPLAHRVLLNISAFAEAQGKIDPADVEIELEFPSMGEGYLFQTEALLKSRSFKLCRQISTENLEGQ